MIMPETRTTPTALPDGGAVGGAVVLGGGGVFGGAGVPPLPEMKKTKEDDVLVETFRVPNLPRKGGGRRAEGGGRRAEGGGRMGGGDMVV